MNGIWESNELQGLEMGILNPGKLRYQAMIGTGGIGSGSFFLLSGNQTLDREESLSGRYLEQFDYCKLHIISHYVQVLLGREFETILISRVGDEKVGLRLLEEMKEAGLNMEYIKALPGRRTLFSFCFIYPDGSGGNLTTDDSACAHVNAEYVARSAKTFNQYAQRGIGLAVPEVPLEARARLIDLASAQTLATLMAAASVTSPHTINKTISRQMLLSLAEKGDIKSEKVLQLLQRA